MSLLHFGLFSPNFIREKFPSMRKQARLWHLIWKHVNSYLRFFYYFWLISAPEEMRLGLFNTDLSWKRSLRNVAIKAIAYVSSFFFFFFVDKYVAFLFHCINIEFIGARGHGPDGCQRAQSLKPNAVKTSTVWNLKYTDWHCGSVHFSFVVYLSKQSKPLTFRITRLLSKFPYAPRSRIIFFNRIYLLFCIYTMKSSFNSLKRFVNSSLFLQETTRWYVFV